jgi:hypothetical protein
MAESARHAGGSSSDRDYRALLLTDLLHTLEEAQQALAVFRLDPEQRVEAQTVFSQIEAARVQIRSLRFTRPSSSNEDRVERSGTTVWS